MLRPCHSALWARLDLLRWSDWSFGQTDHSDHFEHLDESECDEAPEDDGTLGAMDYLDEDELVETDSMGYLEGG